MNTSVKTVVITGASSGIGLALTEAYLKRGYNVVGNARTAERLQAAAEKLGKPDNFLAVAGDIGQAGTATKLFEQAVARFGKVDILINNAGIFIPKPFVEYTQEDLESQIDTNLKGFFYTTQAAARHMSANKSGHIVSISAAIAMQPNINTPASIPVLLKGGINQATRALALELAQYNIKVNAVAPGIIDTPLHTPEMHAFLKTLQPSGRIGNVQEIVDAVFYLADAEFTTGAVLPVDGGATSGKW
jgi:NAD(P)-dependent dehydrogenase (short-subunit alcohol dehydrogenase family)